MKKYLLLAIFTIVFPFGAHVDAQAGPSSCSNDITAKADDDDWNKVMKVEGQNGFVWQRAVITSQPVDFTLKENVPVKIYGVANPHSTVQVFVYAHEDIDGDPSTFEVKKPNMSVCLTGADADETGSFSLEYNPTFLWGNLGQKLVIDAFFQTNELWVDYQKSLPKSNQMATIGSYVLPKVVDIVAGGDAGNCPQICDVKLSESITLNPDDLIYRLKGVNLAYANTEVKLARFPGPHTHYATIANVTDISGDLENLRRTTHKVLGMEMLKRALLGNKKAGGIPPGLNELSVPELLAALEGSSPASNQVKDLVKNIRSVMIYGNNDVSQNMIPQANAPNDPVDPPPNPPPIIYRDEAIIYLTDIMDKGGLGIVDELFPIESSSALNSQWATDFLQLMDFWTDQLDPNLCVMPDDQQSEDNFKQETAGANLAHCDYSYVSGSL